MNVRVGEGSKSADKKIVDKKMKTKGINKGDCPGFFAYKSEPQTNDHQNKMTIFLSPIFLSLGFQTRLGGPGSLNMYRGDS